MIIAIFGAHQKEFLHLGLIGHPLNAKALRLTREIHREAANKIDQPTVLIQDNKVQFNLHRIVRSSASGLRVEVSLVPYYMLGPKREKKFYSNTTPNDISS